MAFLPSRPRGGLNVLHRPAGSPADRCRRGIVPRSCGRKHLRRRAGARRKLGFGLRLPGRRAPATPNRGTEACRPARSPADWCSWGASPRSRGRKHLRWRAGARRRLGFRLHLPGRRAPATPDPREERTPARRPRRLSVLRPPSSGIALPPAATLTTFPTPPRAKLHFSRPTSAEAYCKKRRRGSHQQRLLIANGSWGGDLAFRLLHFRPFLPGFGWGRRRSSPNPTYHQSSTHPQP